MKEIKNSIELKNHILEFKDNQLEIRDNVYINKKFIHAKFSVFLLTIIGLLFFLFYRDTNMTNKKHKFFLEISNKMNDVLGEINCVYEVSNLKKVPLFGKEFIKSSNFSVYLDQN